jgi:hypothetical protein
MKYMLLIHDSEKAWEGLSESERQDIMGRYRKFAGEIRASGQYLGGSQLQPTTNATSVQVRNGKRFVTDGPFAETREQLGGFFLVEARNLDEAIALAERLPSAVTGTIEIRPLVDSPVPLTV